MRYKIDTSDFDRLASQFERIPIKMQRQVIGRAMTRSKAEVTRAYARLAQKRLNIAQKHITSKTRVSASDTGVTVTVRSNNIPLHQMNPQAVGIFGMQTRAADFGVSIPGRGVYEEAFIVSAAARRAKLLVMKRDGTRSTPVKALYGPNPAGEITRNPKEYEHMLIGLFDKRFMSEIQSGLAYMLTQLGTGA